MSLVRRAALVSVTMLLVPAAVSGCIRMAEDLETLCPQGVIERVDVYNYYRDHPIADLQVLDDVGEIAGNCQYTWNGLALTEETFHDEELEQRSTTVLDMHLADGGRRTVWVHRLPGFVGDVAIVYDTGESFRSRRQTIEPYYLDDSHPIGRDEVPTR